MGKGQIEFQEYLSGFAQETHLHRWLDEAFQNDPLQNDFVSKFLRGKR